jgi:hypothetical protein
VVVDLDHFRGINEAAGHLAGDAVLRTVAQCLVGAVRETDTVARIGGDAFACILPHTHLAGALTVAERIRTDVAALRSGPTSELLLPASVGVGTHPAVSVQTPRSSSSARTTPSPAPSKQDETRLPADPGLGARLGRRSTREFGRLRDQNLAFRPGSGVTTSSGDGCRLTLGRADRPG